MKICNMCLICFGGVERELTEVGVLLRLFIDGFLLRA